VKPLAAGSEIDAWCTKCRMDLLHRIVAMVRGRPKRVICMTCNSEHNYREPKSTVGTPRRARPHTTKGKRNTASVSQQARTGATRAGDWELRVVGQPATAFTKYATSEKYEAGQLIRHQRFGDGYVVSVLAEGKITVMFRGGPRTLVHAR
jgi:hypothetical protein